MNSAFEGLQPTIGLRRPGRCLLRRRRPTPGAKRPERPISIGGKAFGHRSACAPNEFGLERPSANGRPAPTGRVSSASAEADAWRAAPGEADFNRREGLRPMVGLRRPGRCLLRRRRPTLGAERLERPISIGGKAFGRWSACAPNEFGLRRPSADGRPVRRMNSAFEGLRPTVGLRRPKRISFASVEADAWRAAPGEADFNRREGLRPMVGLRRPGRCLLRRRRPTLGAERLERPISIGGRAFGRWSACAPNEFGLRRPSANGRPTPTEKDILCVGGGRRLARSAWRGRFQSAGRPSADGRPAPTGEVSSASAKADAWRGAPGEADFNRREGLRPMVGLCAE
jgi:hypothetical protein